jgi:cell filamentation protein
LRKRNNKINEKTYIGRNIMGKYDYTYQDSEGYCYPETDVLKNKLGIKNNEVLTIAEREITGLKLLMLYNMP